MYSRHDLAHDFRKLGVAAGDTIMLHASVRAVGSIAGGPDQIHLALKDALTETGTLIMYASVSEGYDDVGRGHLTEREEQELLDKMPAFDALTVRSARDNGALVEFFRTYPGSLVNNHPARFVVWGKNAEYLISEQPWDFAFGAGSALERLVALDGKILLLASDHDTTTFLHYAEHVIEIPDKRIAHFKVPVNEGGRHVWRETIEVNSETGAHANWPERFFARIVDEYLRDTHNTGAQVGDAPGFLIECRGLLAFALDAMRRTALNGD